MPGLAHFLKNSRKMESGVAQLTALSFPITEDSGSNLVVTKFQRQEVNEEKEAGNGPLYNSKNGGEK